MHRISQWLCFGTLAAAACAMPAKAQVLLYELRGTVDSISDSAGVLGTVATGSSFDLVYRGDFSVGWQSNGGGGGGGGSLLRGGTSEIADPMFPTARISPLSAVLTINGHQLSFSGEYLGDVEYAYNDLGEIFGGGPGVSWAIFSAQAGLRADNSLSSDVESRLDAVADVNTFNLSVDHRPLSLTIDGTINTGTTSFSYVWGADTPQETVITGALTPLNYSVTEAAVPEPAEWLLLALGLAALPALAWRRR